MSKILIGSYYFETVFDEIHEQYTMEGYLVNIDSNLPEQAIQNMKDKTSQSMLLYEEPEFKKNPSYKEIRLRNVIVYPVVTSNDEKYICLENLHEAGFGRYLPRGVTICELIPNNRIKWCFGNEF